FDIAENHIKPATDTVSKLVVEEPVDIEAWRICRAWKRILGVTLNLERVAAHLRRIDRHRPAPLVDRVLAECETRSRVDVLAEIESWAATRLKKENGSDEERPVNEGIKKLR